MKILDCVQKCERCYGMCPYYMDMGTWLDLHGEAFPIQIPIETDE